MFMQAVAVASRRVLVRGQVLALALGVCGFAAAMALSAHVEVFLPFSPVPLSLQTMVVLLSGATLGASGGAAAQALYLGIGVLGMPVFTAGGGPEVLAGPTVGYLVAFPLTAWLVGRLARRREAWALPLALTTGTLLILLLGSTWLVVGCGRSVPEAVMLGFVPFLAGDTLKAVAAGALAPILRRGYEAAAGHH